jgi:hypothetical protein
METINLNNQEQQLNEFFNGGDEDTDTTEPGRDEADQSDFPDTDDLDEELADDGLTDDQDQTEVDHSANDADGNGGYPDVANPAELNS